MTLRRAVGIGGLAVAAVVVGGVLVWRQQGHGTATATTPVAGVATTQVRRTNLTATELVNGTLGWSALPPVTVRRAGTWTQLPNPGDVVTPGHPLAEIDNRPVLLMAGAVPAWRPIGLGVPDGPDIRELQEGLRSLGMDPSNQLHLDDRFTASTATAIRRLQHSLGETETGALGDGDIVFEPGPVRVGAIHAALGGAARPGDSPFDTTGTTRVVNVQLDPGRQRGLQVGEAVTVDLLDGATTPGVITSLGRVATVAASTQGSGPGTPTVAMTVTLSDPNAGGTFDQAPVQVRLSTATRPGVLAVPVTALLALAEGGYGVEVIEPGGAHHVVAVTPGLYADTAVEITGTGITEGTTVVTAR